MKNTHNSRRQFLKTTAVVSAATIVPRHVLGGVGYKAPSDTLVIAGVGVGGMGGVYLRNCESENIAVLCDVDYGFAQRTFDRYPDAVRYYDYRRMLDQERGIDAVVIGTPDHTHAVIAMAAFDLGKHIYCAKPLTRTIYESRKMLAATKASGVATQMSTQGQAEDGPRRLKELVNSGAIGAVHHVHIWSDRPIWPQGVDRPEERMEKPNNLNWDLWLGPAPDRPYHSAYHPFRHRGWIDFGTGALGDMGCHAFDPVFRALDLVAPTKVYGSCTTITSETFPSASVVHYEFPARGSRPPVKLSWYDGGLKPPRPGQLEAGKELGRDGLIFEGEKGTIMSGFTGANPHLVPEAEMDHFERPPKTIASSIGHYNEWIEACKGGPEAPCHFGWGAPLTEIVLLGNVALRTGRTLDWDAEKGEFVGDSDANAFIQEPYRAGWTL
ncbi:MAG: Gfo/Idh/MocA family oxidoreductase [Rhodothermaceae bacterium]|nr:Gfo/Idh/MocA family oxidoreductase [Rhodothermaceae bacterium]